MPKAIRGAKTGLYLIPDKANCLRARCNNEVLSIAGIEKVINKKIGNLIILDSGDQYIIRKLTPIECERLQTLPDNYTEGISNTQRYKCIGNGWTVDVIVHILKYINY